MKICLIAPIPPFRGGIAKYCHSLARELEGRHDLLLLSYRRQYPTILYGKKSQLDPAVNARAIGEGFKRLSYDIDSASPLSWRATARQIAAFAPELVIIPWWVAYWAPMYAYLVSSCRKRGIKVLFLCINVFEHEDTFLKRTLTKFILKRVDSIVVHSRQERDAALGINSRATVVQHLLPLFDYPPVAADRVKPPTLRLLFFGFVRQYKGLDTLLQALALLQGRDVRLTVAGEFWHDKDRYLELIRTCALEGKVEIVDRYLSDDEMGGYFSRADLVVVPYRRSITSGVIATAYGFGKPVLATAVGNFGDVVKDGYTGKLVPPNDPQALAAGIRWFLENRSLDFAANIAAFAAREMSWRSLVETIEELATRC